MSGIYEKGMYNQLVEVMAHLYVVERNLRVEKREHKEDVNKLNERIDE